MTEKPAAEEYVYHIGKIRFIVTPVYKETGELKRSTDKEHFFFGWNSMV